MPSKRRTPPAKRKRTAPSEFVLDASITLAWFFDDETSEYAEAVQDVLQHASVVVPPLWPLEVANALLVGERRKRTTETKVTRFLRLLDSLPVTVIDGTNTRAATDVLALARSHGLSVYDAAYLDLALRRSLPLATLDLQLQKAVQEAGIALYAA